MTTKENAEKSLELSEIENTEIGEYWNRLVDLYLYNEIYMSDEVFHTQVGVEIEVQYQYALDMIDDGELEIE